MEKLFVIVSNDGIDTTIQLCNSIEKVKDTLKERIKEADEELDENLIFIKPKVNDNDSYINNYNLEKNDVMVFRIDGIVDVDVEEVISYNINTNISSI